MDRRVAIYKGRRYKAITTTNEIFLILYHKEEGFQVSPYNKNMFKKEIQKKDLTEFYREYFMAHYKNYDFFVIREFKESQEIEIITYNSSIGRECELDCQDRDLFTKRLGINDSYQLIYVKEDYLSNTTTRKEVTLEEYYRIDNQQFE